MKTNFEHLLEKKKLTEFIYDLIKIGVVFDDNDPSEGRNEFCIKWGIEWKKYLPSDIANYLSDEYKGKDKHTYILLKDALAINEVIGSTEEKAALLLSRPSKTIEE